MTFGTHMRSEVGEAPAVFADALPSLPVVMPDLSEITAIDTIARGSSDAVATILSYGFMRALGIAMSASLVATPGMVLPCTLP